MWKYRFFHIYFLAISQLNDFPRGSIVYIAVVFYIPIYIYIYIYKCGESPRGKGAKKFMKKTLKKIFGWFTGTFVALVVLLAIALVGVRLVGLKPFVVLSGSMEPTYHVGSLVYVKEVDYKTLQVGDPITYMVNDKTVVTHRITEILVDENDPDTHRYFTKGDANEAEDGTSTHYKNIIGKPIFSIPYLGYVSSYIQHPPGTYVALVACALMIFLVFLPDIFTFGEEEQKKETQEKSASEE